MITKSDIGRGLRKAGIAAVAMVATLLLVACSSGGDAPEAPPTPPTEPTDPTTPTTPDATSQLEIPIYVSMSAAPFADGTERQNASRRAWTPPTGYTLYSELYGEEDYVNQPFFGQSTIDLFMTHDIAEGFTSPNPLHARLSYNSSTKKWKLGLPHGVEETDVKTGNYYAFGFIPRDAADTAKIAYLTGSTKWEDGAVLTIKGLKNVATDPCVIIGAKEGPNVNEDNGLRAGDFQFSLDTGKTTVDDKEVINPNYLYFLFDHLYSSFSISMKVNSTYHSLRHIKLKKLELKTLTSEGVSPYKSDVIITLRANNTGTNPVSDSDIKFENTVDYKDVDNPSPNDGVIYSKSAGILLTTEPSLFLGNFMPKGVSKLILTSTYDVYDTNVTPEHPDGNLVRENCTATNTLLISKLFDGQTESKRGWKYPVNLTINPTYLYMMSDPDLDNPTVVVN